MQLDSVPSIPVAVDANVLRNDVLYAVRNERPTALVTTASARFIRLYCAAHVLEEVREHYRRWSREGRVEPEKFVATWNALYAAFLNVAEPDSLGLFSAEESERLSRLERIDRDDLASARLSILLNAIFLSEDKAASEAVYGASVETRREWRTTLMAGGDAGALGYLAQASATTVRMLVMGGIALSDIIKKPTGWATVGFAASTALVIASRSRWFSSAVGSVIRALALVAELEDIRQAAAKEISDALPIQQPWRYLSSDIGQRAMRARAILFVSGRSGYSDRSAAEIVEQMKRVGVYVEVAAVRELLRDRKLLVSTRRGRWALGELDPSIRSTEADGGQS